MDKFELIKDWEGGKVCSIASHEDKLYLGGSDGKIYLYNIEQKASTREYVAVLAIKKTAKSKKPITSIQLDVPDKKVFFLIDQVVHVHEMTNLTHIRSLDEFKNVSSFAVDKNYSHQLCLVISKKKLVFVDYKNKDYEGIREMKSPVGDSIVEIEFMKNTVCLAYGKNRVVMLNHNTGGVNQQLKKMNLSSMMNEEFLVYSSFVKVIRLRGIVSDLNADDDIRQDNIVWTDQSNMHAIGICFPFLVGVGKQGIEVYNLYEQAITDQYPMPSKDKFISILSDMSGRIYVSRGNNLILLTQKSIEKQIDDMIENGRIIEAFSIFEKTFSGSKWDKDIRYKQLNEKAAASCFFKSRFKEAFDYYNRTDIDPREILYYFPDLHYPGFNYKPRVDRGSLRERLKEVIEENNEDARSYQIDLRIKNAKKSTIEYLAKIRRPKGDTYNQQQNIAIDYAIMKAYLRDFKNYGELKSLLAGPNHLSWSIARDVLENNARYAAYLHASKKEYRSALKLLKELSEGKVKETTTNTDGIEESIEILCEVNDKSLVFEFAEWVFDRDESSAISIFTSKLRDKPLPPTEVLSFLEVYPVDLKIVYLEYLINEEGNSEERYCTLLLTHYLSCIMRLKPQIYLPFGVRVDAGAENGILGVYRRKLIHLLEHSNNYDKTAILNIVQNTPLYEETLILYKKLKHHDAALELLLHKIQDFEWAERYCIDSHAQIIEERKSNQSAGVTVQKSIALDAATKPRRLRRGTYLEEQEDISLQADLEEINPLFIILLRICLQPEQGYDSNHTLALHILNKYAKHINPVEALSLIPDDMPLIKLNDYLRQTIQTSKNRYRQTLVIFNLAKIQYAQTKARLGRGLSRRVTIKEGTNCAVCKKSIDASSVFIVLPDLTTVHYKCSDKEMINRHPITGEKFEKFPVDLEAQISAHTVLNPPNIYNDSL